jgi:hypothetical protein
MKIFYIIQGWFNHFLFKMGMKNNPKWNERLKICQVCPTNINGVCSKKICEIIDNRRTCGCGCPVSKKIKSNKRCPKGHWR